MLFALGMVFVFGLGGLTGIFLGPTSPDLYLHDTMFVVGHFHFTMAAASFLASFAGIYFWFPKMFGRKMDETLGKIHFWFSVVGHHPGLRRPARGRLRGPAAAALRPVPVHVFKHLQPLNRWTSYAAFALFFGQLLFVLNFFHSMCRGKKAEANPWQVGTLEWSIPSPPPVHNFDVIPVVVRGPHEYSNPEMERKLGRDWVGQAEVVASEEPGSVRTAARGAT